MGFHQWSKKEFPVFRRSFFFSSQKIRFEVNLFHLLAKVRRKLMRINQNSAYREIFYKRHIIVFELHYFFLKNFIELNQYFLKILKFKE
jgi:hypothetical protein